jgi:hypothetical protein
LIGFQHIPKLVLDSVPGDDLRFPKLLHKGILSQSLQDVLHDYSLDFIAE